MSESTAKAIREIINECIVVVPGTMQALRRTSRHTKVKAFEQAPVSKYFRPVLVCFYADEMICEGETGAFGFHADATWAFPRPSGTRGLPDDTKIRISTWHQWKMFRKLTLAGLPVRINPNSHVTIGDELVGDSEPEAERTLRGIEKVLGRVDIAAGLNISALSGGASKAIDYYMAFCKFRDGRIGLASTDSHRMHVQYDGIFIYDDEILEAPFPAWLTPHGTVTLYKFTDGRYAAAFDNVTVYMNSLVGAFPPADKVIPESTDTEIDLTPALDGLRVLAAKEFGPCHKTYVRTDGTIYGKAGEVAEIHAPENFGGVGFNASYVLDAVAFSGTTEMKMTTANNPLTFGDSRLAVVMPIRGAEEAFTPKTADQSADPSPDIHEE